MSTFRAGGLMSGLDTNTIIEQLVALERVPIQKLQQRQDLMSTQRSLFTQVESALSALKTKISSWDTNGELLAYQATSSNEDALTATATGEAVAGAHTVRILQTARAEQDRSQAFTASTDEVRAGTLTLTVQGEDAVDVTIEEGYSLADVAYAINRSEAEVSAAVIDTGTEAYLTIYALETGHEPGTLADEALTITESYTGSSGAELTLTQTVQARNASIEFDGLAVERRSNSISDVIPGLAMQLVDDSGQPTVGVLVEADTDGLKSNLQEFVGAYNTVMELLATQFEVGADQSTGVLFGDGTFRSLMLQLQSALTESVDDAGGNFSTLREAGLKITSTGSLSIDDSDLNDAMAEDFRGIASLFTTDSTGLVDRLDSLIEDYTDSVDGIFKRRKEGLDDRHENLAQQIDRMELRVEAFERRLVTQFTSLETVIGQLRSQQDYLMSVFGATGG